MKAFGLDVVVGNNLGGPAAESLYALSVMN